MSFAYRLFQLVSNENGDANPLIEWCNDGAMFKIIDTARFEESIIPKWFSHKNYSSFIRQLNIYG
jgi:hypothetical protein